MAKDFKTGVLLVNLGTPDEPKVSAVRRYLREFLMDKRVVDIPAILRFILVNGIIAPFRAPKSTKEYKKLWDERGSSLKYFGFDIEKMLQEAMGDKFVVKLAMRYQNPSIQEGLDVLRNTPVKKIIVVPLFPQYASATTGSVHDKVMEIVMKWQTIPEMVFISRFQDNDDMIDIFAEHGKKLMDEHHHDHVLFSYHGLPERQIRKGSFDGHCKLGSCCNHLGPRNELCYRAQCFHTSRLIAEKLNLKKEDYTVSFQSRLGTDPWVKPYTEDMVKELAEQGKKKVLAYSPAFVADCLETTIEVGETYQEEFIEEGGERWDLVPSLNDDPKWVEALKKMVLQYCP